MDSLVCYQNPRVLILGFEWGLDDMLQRARKCFRSATAQGKASETRYYVAWEDNITWIIAAIHQITMFSSLIAQTGCAAMRRSPKTCSAC
jgi:hypothetical protein